MKPEEIIAYCRLAQRTQAAYDAQVGFVLINRAAHAGGPVELFKGGPLGTFLREDRDTFGNVETVAIFRANEVIQSVQARLQAR